jgi:hypothetical protein
VFRNTASVVSRQNRLRKSKIGYDDLPGRSPDEAFDELKKMLDGGI